jgi:cytochrome c oxidase assembly protein subunit 15
LLVIPQALLGALAVWRELQAAVVTLHFATALALLTALLVTAARAGLPTGPPPSPAAARGTSAALVLAAITLVLGGLTASTHAGFACQGFPLCSGRLWPSGESGLAEIQWVHRLAAYALVLHLIGLAMGFRKRGEAPAVRRLAWIALVAASVQIGVAAVMVLRTLPAEWRALHAAVGTAVWAALVWLGARTLPWAAGRVWNRRE